MVAAHPARQHEGSGAHRLSPEACAADASQVVDRPHPRGGGAQRVGEGRKRLLEGEAHGVAIQRLRAEVGRPRNLAGLIGAGQDRVHVGDDRLVRGIGAEAEVGHDVRGCDLTAHRRLELDAAPQPEGPHGGVLVRCPALRQTRHRDVGAVLQGLIGDEPLEDLACHVVAVDDPEGSERAGVDLQWVVVGTAAVRRRRGGTRTVGDCARSAAARRDDRDQESGTRRKQERVRTDRVTPLDARNDPPLMSLWLPMAAPRSLRLTGFRILLPCVAVTG